MESFALCFQSVLVSMMPSTDTSSSTDLCPIVFALSCIPFMFWSNMRHVLWLGLMRSPHGVFGRGGQISFVGELGVEGRGSMSVSLI